LQDKQIHGNEHIEELISSDLCMPNTDLY